MSPTFQHQPRKPSSTPALPTPPPAAPSSPSGDAASSRVSRPSSPSGDAASSRVPSQRPPPSASQRPSVPAARHPSRPASQPQPLVSARALSAAAIPLWLLAVIAIGFVLRTAQTVVLPLVIAWLLAYVLAPPVNFLARRCRIPAFLATIIILGVLFALAVMSGNAIQVRLLAFIQRIPAYQPKIAALLTSYADRFNIPHSVLASIDIPGTITTNLVRLTRVLLSLGYNSILVVVFLAFMLASRPYGANKLIAAFPERAEALSALLATISRQIATYLGVLFFLSLATGLTVWAALLLLGVDFAFTWGLLAFLLNFIPTFGSVVATILPIITALVQHGGALGPALLVTVVLAAIQLIYGNVIGPKFYGDRLNLSPVTILLFLLFWGWLWGVPGLLLAVPLAAVIQITLAHIPAVAPLAIIMGSSRNYAPSRAHDVPTSTPDAPRKRRHRRRRHPAASAPAP